MIDKKGLSVLVGFVLLLSILIISLSLIQVNLVPALCKEVELKHENSILYSVYALTDKLMEDSLATITFNLGVHYPSYPFLVSPPTSGCTLVVDKFKINVTYEELLPNGTWVNRQISINTTRLTIYLNYFYNKGYKIVFENTAVFKADDEDKYIILSHQKMFENEIKIVGINSTFQSMSTTQPIDVWLEPVSYGGYVIARNITVEFESDYPDYWKNLTGYDVSVNGDKVTIKYDNVTILRISYFLLTRGQYPYKLEPERIIPTNPTTNYTLGVNKSIILGVKVVDKYNNPVRGERINVTVSNESVGRVNVNKTYTNFYGNAYVIFTANSTGFTKVIFKFNESKNELKVEYNINVTRYDQEESDQGEYGSYDLYCIWYDANNESCISVYGHNVDEKPPDDNETPNEPISDSDLEKIKRDDGVFFESKGYMFKHAAQRFIFKGLRNDDKVDKTIIMWNGYGKWVGQEPRDEGATIYLWNYTQGKYDEKMKVIGTHSSEFGFNIIINSYELNHYINDNGEMIILVVQNHWGCGRWKGKPSVLGTDYICVIQIIKK